MTTTAKSVSKANEWATPTAAQLKYAESLAIKAGYPQRYATQAAARDMFGGRAQRMNRERYSQLIDSLVARTA